MIAVSVDALSGGYRKEAVEEYDDKEEQLDAEQLDVASEESMPRLQVIGVLDAVVACRPDADETHYQQHTQNADNFEDDDRKRTDVVSRGRDSLQYEITSFNSARPAGRPSRVF